MTCLIHSAILNCYFQSVISSEGIGMHRTFRTTESPGPRNMKPIFIYLGRAPGLNNHIKKFVTGLIFLWICEILLLREGVKYKKWIKLTHFFAWIWGFEVIDKVGFRQRIQSINNRLSSKSNSELSRSSSYSTTTYLPTTLTLLWCFWAQPSPQLLPGSPWLPPTPPDSPILSIIWYC